MKRENSRDRFLLKNSFADLRCTQSIKNVRTIFLILNFTSFQNVSNISNSQNPSLSCLLHLIKVDLGNETNKGLKLFTQIHLESQFHGESWWSSYLAY